MKSRNFEILLIEDNMDHAEIIMSELNQADDGKISIHLAHDGQEAMEYLFQVYGTKKKKDLVPDLIILDLKLPRVSGLEILKKIKKDPRLKLVPTVILTTSTQLSDIKSSYESGANSYVTKSVKFEKFIEKIQSIGFYWKSINKQSEVRNRSIE